MKRVCVYPKDVQWITGKSESEFVKVSIIAVRSRDHRSAQC
jgi:hypothetical protein